MDTPTTSVSNKPLLPQLDDNIELWEDINQEYGLSGMDDMVGIHGDLEVSVDDEYTSYITAPLSHHPINFVNYWDVCLLLCLFIPLFLSCVSQISQNQYPTFFQMAMDYLPIQASAVPCERAFSSGAETVTARRNRIKPPLMEALQMLKFALRKSHLNFTDDWLTSEQLMDEKEEENDVLESLIYKFNNTTVGIETFGRDMFDDDV